MVFLWFSYGFFMYVSQSILPCVHPFKKTASARRWKLVMHCETSAVSEDQRLGSGGDVWQRCAYGKKRYVLYIYIHMYIYTRIYICIYVYIHTYIYIYIRIYICIYVYTYIYIYVFIYVYMYVCVWSIYIILWSMIIILCLWLIRV